MNLNEIKVKVGDKVLVKNSAGHKLDNIYTGPFTVKSIDNMNNCIIIDEKQKETKIHKDRLRVFPKLN